MLNKDYKEMLQCLLEESVRFLLVGAYAVAAALRKFGAPLDDISESDFSSEGVIFQIGNSPRRIDIITHISGVKFEHAYANRQAVFIEDIEVPVISLQDLIANKRASGRTQDLADIEKLETTQPQKKQPT
jgi:predicted nucleotidyltransferase